MIVFIAAQPFGVGIIFPPGVHQAPVRVAEHWVILVGVIHPYARRHHAPVTRIARAGVARVATLRVSHVRITRVLSMLRPTAARPTRPLAVTTHRQYPSKFYSPNGLRGKIHQEFTAPVLLGPGAA